MRVRMPALLGALAALAVLVTGCSGGATSSHTGAEPKVVTWAEGPASTPNYIFPMESGPVFSTTNDVQFSQLMYLPLYWFGNNGEPLLNQALSVANPPKFSDGNRTATITLKHWQWSNGKPITARDVIFWLNLMSAATDPNTPTIGTSSSPGPGWGAQVPGGFPQNIVTYKQIGTYSLQLQLNSSYNPTWYLYNELSQVFPIPQAAWDKLSLSGTVGNYDQTAAARTTLPATTPPSYVPERPGTANSGALGVAQFLNEQSQTLATYTTSPLWQVVDGPFRLSQFTAAGFVKLVPNKAYSGTPKPKIAAFEELPFTSDFAEFNAVVAGAVSIGYIPPEDLGRLHQLEANGYRFSPWYDFGISFMRYNFTNPTNGPIFRQLYFRQAFQSLVDQPEYIKQFLGGYGSQTVGPVPEYPKSDPNLSTLVKSGAVYPYSPSHAVALLSSHGWNVKPGGVTTCVHPGAAQNECGAGVKAGQALDFAVLYASGTPAVASEMEALQSTAAQDAGISLSLSSAPFPQVQAIMHGHCTFATPCSDWTIANNGGGWVYGPDYLPTGGELFALGSGPNLEYYDSSTNQANIELTHTAATTAAETAALQRYENYLATQLPVVWLPTAPFRLTVYKKNLANVVPQGILAEIYPQFYAVH